MLLRMAHLVCALLFVGLPLRASVENVSVDGFKYDGVRSIPREMLYSQMWYFNFIDDDNGIAGVLGAGVVNPNQKMFPMGQTSAILALLRPATDGDSFYTWSPHYDPHKSENFFASPTFAPDVGVQFFNPAMTIKVVSPDEYLIEAILKDQNRTVAAKLYYDRAPDGLGTTWVPWANIKLPKLFGLISGRATYTMQMPDARVSGTITISEEVQGKTVEKVYTIKNARGYHDGYYGSATLIPTFKWDWMSYQQSNMAIEMINPHGPLYRCSQSKDLCTPGNLRVSVKTSESAPAEIVEFSKSQIQIHYDEMKIDEQYPSVPYPNRETITARDSAGNRLSLHWKNLNYLKVFYHPPKPMSDLPTYEIVAHLTGTFYSAKANQEVPIDGTGWVDYSNNK